MQRSLEEYIYRIFTAILAAGALYWIFYQLIGFQVNFSFAPCVPLTHFHIYCPGCGGTRAIEALMNLRIIQAVLCNPALVYLVFMLAYYYIGTTIARISSDRIIVFRFRLWMVYVGMVLFIGGAVIRNILAIYYHVDYLGDISPFW